MHRIKFNGKYPLTIKNNETQFTSYRVPKLRSNIDLRYKCPPIYDQLQLGSCTANALVSAFKFNDNTNFFGSRLFLYYNERMLDKDVNIDAGSTLKQGINALKIYGVCNENLWTYSDDATKFKTKPPNKAYIDGLNHQIISSNAVKQDLKSMKECLNYGFPFVAGIIVYESFESEEVAKTGFVPMPKNNETILGGHAVLCVGFDDIQQVFIMRNSWGVKWGNKGCN